MENNQSKTKTDIVSNSQLSSVPKPKCHNCKHASPAFKVGKKTYHQCNHIKHKSGMLSGEISAWDTLQEWYNTCDTHEFR